MVLLLSALRLPSSVSACLCPVQIPCTGWQQPGEMVGWHHPGETVGAKMIDCKDHAGQGMPGATQATKLERARTLRVATQRPLVQLLSGGRCGVRVRFASAVAL